MISVHILVKADRSIDYEEKLSRCIDSLKNQPIDLKLYDHIEDNVGLARSKAIQKSKSEWISWVDPDDYVVDEGFSHCWNLIQQEPKCSAVYTNHWIAADNVKKRTWFSELSPNIGYSQQHQMHHLVIYNKKVIEPELKFIEGTKTKYKTLLNLAAIYHGKVIGTKEPFYVWNEDGNQNHLRHSFKDNPQIWHERVHKYRKHILKK